MLEIIVIVGAVSIVVGVLGRYIYKRVHKLPTGECACCQQKKKQLVKKYHKKYKR